MRILVMLIVGWGIFYGAQDAAASPRRAPRLGPPAEATSSSVAADERSALPMLTPDERELLDTALANSAAEIGHWAYTQTSRSDDDEGDTIARFDPSQAEGEQWTLLQRDGRVPEAREKERWEKKRTERSAKGQSLGELIELTGARLASADGAELVVDVPLREVGNDRFPPEKFRVLLTVDRAKMALTGIEVKLREPFRVLGVVKITDGALAVTYAEVDPAHPPQPVSVSGGGHGKILFVKVDGSFAVTRTDFARVEPYSNRYDVEVGELKVLDF